MLRHGPLVLVTVLVACNGLIGEPGASGSTGRTPSSASVSARAPVTDARRLTVYELDNTLRDLVGDETRPAGEYLPADVRMPFDNDANTQVASQALVEGVERLALVVASRLVSDVARRDRVVGCTPSGPGDEECLRSFIATFGMRALRRPLEDAEIDLFLGARDVAIAAGDFYAGVEVVVAALLQDPELLYRIEAGVPVAGEPGLLALTAWEKAARLSYFLWSTTPDDALFGLARDGGLDTPAGVAAAARAMLDDPRAEISVDRFHAMWLGYESLPHEPELALAMRAETRALLGRVVFEERRPWIDVLTAGETFIGDDLALHYGLPDAESPEPSWVSYRDTGRRGLLSHGTFLALGAKFGDTSPTIRGREVRTRLLCQTIPEPPPGVDVDEPIPVTDSPCKWDRFAEHRSGGCASCHQLMDPVGFGLERYDALGRYRVHDDGLPQCPIEGTGEIVDVGTFEGPAGLADLLVENGEIEGCLATQLYRFAVGRTRLDSGDATEVAHVVDGLGRGVRLDDLLVAIVSDESFGYRREAE